jgi:hypothetical protein
MGKQTDYFRTASTIATVSGPQRSTTSSVNISLTIPAYLLYFNYLILKPSRRSFSGHARMKASKTFKYIPLDKFKIDPEAAALLDAPQMAIYDRILMAAMQNRDEALRAALRDLSAIPLSQRYVWGIISALGFAFGDFDSACIKLDLDTLPFKKTDKMREVIEFRAAQFCILMREFFGDEGMKIIMYRAIDNASAQPQQTNPSAFAA